MYYQEGLTQETIAKKLRTSRPAVSLLLAEARKTGVVQIKIKDPEVNNEELAGQFQKRFGLKKCLVIPCGIRQEDVVLKIVASQAARFASRMMKSHTTVGTSWGGSCYEFMQAFPEDTELCNITVVPLVGGSPLLTREFQLIESVREFSEKLRGTPVVLYSPGFVDTIEDKKRYMGSLYMQSVLEKWRTLDFAVICLLYTSLGDRGMVYAAIINTIVTVAMWTVGFVVMGKEGERISIRKVALNPGAVGVYIGLPLLLFSLELPDPFQSVVGFLADMNTPLAMICIGVFISKTKLLDIFKEKTLYWVTVIRLLLIPAAVMGILLLFQPDYIPMTSSIIQFCAPSAGLTAIFAARFRHDTTLAAKTVAISTLLSILTMPLFCVALQTIYGV